MIARWNTKRKRNHAIQVAERKPGASGPFQPLTIFLGQEMERFRQMAIDCERGRLIAEDRMLVLDGELAEAQLVANEMRALLDDSTIYTQFLEARFLIPEIMVPVPPHVLYRCFLDNHTNILIRRGNIFYRTRDLFVWRKVIYTGSESDLQDRLQRAFPSENYAYEEMFTN